MYYLVTVLSMLYLVPCAGFVWGHSGLDLEQNRAYSESTLAHPSEEIQEGAISREDDCFIFFWIMG
jgi:hypothetical protein